MNLAGKPLGDNRWHRTTAAEDGSDTCVVCGKPIYRGAICYAHEAERRHVPCQLKARHESMTGEEQVEMMRRLVELCEETAGEEDELAAAPRSGPCQRCHADGYDRCVCETETA